MSTPRKPRASYNNLPASPLTEDEFHLTVLQKCGVTDEKLNGMVVGAMEAIEGALDAETSVPEYERGKVVNYRKEVDHQTRLRAADMIHKLAGTYPHKGQTSNVAPVIINVPPYYHEGPRITKVVNEDTENHA